MKFILFLTTAAAAVAALPSVGPDYVAPKTDAPASYRDPSANGGWKMAAPADTLTRGAWWKLFGDAALDDLEAKALAANQDLRAAAARVDQANASAGIARSGFWPQVGVNPSATREQTSKTTDNVFPAALSTTYRAPLVASWELDLFGRVRRLSESARAEAEGSADLLESVRLSLTAEVASNYFAARALDREIAILRDTTALRRRTLDLIAVRIKGGTATDLDTARAEAELASAEADTAAVAGRREAVQNALAVLVGQAASNFALAADVSTPSAPPTVPPGLPSDLLERRPDIAAAERALAAANARIGVAKAAFFPAISLTGSAGFASGDIDHLTNSDSRIWSIGPSLYLPIFQGGRNRANLERSRAAYDESVAVFRQRVLVAFREVQDALAATSYLTEQSAAQTRAVLAARRAATIAQKRYDSGFVSYLEVIDTQRTALATERADVQLAAQRLITGVALIKSLGGGWTVPAQVAAR